MRWSWGQSRPPRAVPQEQKVALDSMRRLKYEVALGSWYGDYPDPSTFLDCFRTGDKRKKP